MHGIVRPSTFNTQRLDQTYADPHQVGIALKLHYGDSASPSPRAMRILELGYSYTPTPMWTKMRRSA